MDQDKLLSSMSREVRNSLSTAVEIGRWPDGTQLNQQQKSTCLQAVIAWDSKYGEETNEPFKISKGGIFNGHVKKTEGETLTPSHNNDIIKTFK